jgi:hypothetical protein
MVADVAAVAAEGAGSATMGGELFFPQAADAPQAASAQHNPEAALRIGGA